MRCPYHGWERRGIDHTPNRRRAKYRDADINRASSKTVIRGIWTGDDAAALSKAAEALVKV